MGEAALNNIRTITKDMIIAEAYGASRDTEAIFGRCRTGKPENAVLIVKAANNVIAGDAVDRCDIRPAAGTYALKTVQIGHDMVEGSIHCIKADACC
jgi:hypothetical protein